MVREELWAHPGDAEEGLTPEPFWVVRVSTELGPKRTAELWYAAKDLVLSRVVLDPEGSRPESRWLRGTAQLRPEVGHRLGFPLDAESVQPTLDFGERDTELFKGHEMGEDIRRILKKYSGQLDDIRRRINKEKPVLETALLWVRKSLK